MGRLWDGFVVAVVVGFWLSNFVVEAGFEPPLGF